MQFMVVFDDFKNISGLLFRETRRSGIGSEGRTVPLGNSKPRRKSAAGNILPPGLCNSRTRMHASPVPSQRLNSSSQKTSPGRRVLSGSPTKHSPRRILCSPKGKLKPGQARKARALSTKTREEELKSMRPSSLPSLRQ